MAEAMVSRLRAEGYLDLVGDSRTVIQSVGHAITEELLTEDRLNTEVRELMKAYATEIEKGPVDYQKMFTLIKSKLVKERGLIL